MGARDRQTDRDVESQRDTIMKRGTDYYTKNKGESGQKKEGRKQSGGENVSGV